MLCVEDQSVAADEGKPTAMVAWEDPTASDNSGIISHVTCDPMSGTIFTIGQTRVTCEAVDESGNQAKCSFKVIIRGICTLRQVFSSQMGERELMCSKTIIGSNNHFIHMCLYMCGWVGLWL